MRNGQKMDILEEVSDLIPNRTERNENPAEEVVEDVPSGSGDPAASKDTIEETLKLYLFHASEKLFHSGLRCTLDHLDERVRNPSQNAIALKKLGSKFTVKRILKRVREQAKSVNLYNLEHKEYEELLCNIFRDGEGEVPWKRVLVLYHFCSDLAVRAIGENAASTFINTYGWTNSYLSVKIAPWVEEHGGWSEILQEGRNLPNYATRLSVLGFCCITALAIFIYIRNK